MTATASDRFDEVFEHIEANLFEPLSVRELAGVAGLSPFHFSRLFTIRTGNSVMSYVRLKRMMHAAERLRAGEEVNLVELAFDCGFESQEAFTRAFQRALGMPPGRFKCVSKAYAEGETHVSAMPQTKPDLSQLPGLVHRDAFTVVGVSAHFGDENMSAIPTLWPRLLQRLPIAGQVDGRTYGVGWIDNAKEGGFMYMPAVEVAPNAKAPEGLELLRIPAQTYLVFRLKIVAGDLHPQMKAASQEIWAQRLPKSGHKPNPGYELEFYDEGFRPGVPGAIVDFHIPVENPR